MKIVLKDFGIDDRANLGVTAVDTTGTHELRFSLPTGYVPANDLIGLALAPLLGTKYDEIGVELPLSDPTVAVLERITQASIAAPTQPLSLGLPAGNNVGLNFSGGFDSLAALALMPEEHKLVSIDFGGAFAREEKFFSTFDTATISTNFRQEGFAANHWTFMGVGPILLRDYLQLGSYSFGSILESSPWNLMQTRFSNSSQPVFKAAGLRQYNPLLGLTEIGAVILLARRFPELAPASLSSLAAQGSEKYTRKALIYNMVLDLLGETTERLPATEIEPQYVFGERLPSDLRTLYMVKRAGLDAAQQLVGEVPTEILEFIKERELRYFERLNPTFYEALDTEQKETIYARCLAVGIEPYSERDWTEYRESITLLSAWHKSIRR